MEHKEIIGHGGVDCHVHTPYSVCCEDISLEKLQEEARLRDIAFVVTDHSAHLYFPPDMAWSLMKDDFPDRFRAYRDRGRRAAEQYIRELRAQQIPVGLELDVYTDGTLVFEEDLFDDLDLVIGSIHRLDALLGKAPPETAIDEFKRLTLRLLTCGRVHVLGHPFRMLRNAGIAVPDRLIEWVADRCLENDVALEINSHYRFPEEDIRMARLARRKNVPLVRSSDAHAIKEFGDFSYHDAIFKAAGEKQR